MIIWRHLTGLQAYEPIWRAMQRFNQCRNADSPDEIWFLQHQPVYTQGLNGKDEHILAPGHIPIVHIDRGGQVTYHGPGQLVVYFLLDIKRRQLSPRQLVSTIEQAVIDTLAQLGCPTYAKVDAPGVYANEAKFASIGLRIKSGSSYHGLSVNVDMDLAPFQGINPCGYERLAITQVSQLVPKIDIQSFQNHLQPQLQKAFAS